MATTITVSERVGEDSEQAHFKTRTSSISAANDIHAIKIKKKEKRRITELNATGFVENYGWVTTNYKIDTDEYSALADSLDSKLAGAVYDLDGSDTGPTYYAYLPADLDGSEDNYIYLMDSPGDTCSIYTRAEDNPANDDTISPVLVRIGDEYISCKASGSIDTGHQIDSTPPTPVNTDAKGWLKIYKRGCTRWGENVDDDDSGDGLTGSVTGETFSRVKRHDNLVEVLNYGREEGTDVDSSGSTHDNNAIHAVFGSGDVSGWDSAGTFFLGDELITYSSKPDTGTVSAKIRSDTVQYGHYIGTYGISDTSGDGPLASYGDVVANYSFKDNYYDYRDNFDKNVQKLYDALTIDPTTLEVTTHEAAKTLSKVGIGDLVNVTDDKTNIDDTSYRVIKYDLFWSRGMTPELKVWLSNDSIRDEAIMEVLNTDEFSRLFMDNRDTNSALHNVKEFFDKALDFDSLRKGYTRIKESGVLDFLKGDETGDVVDTRIYRSGGDLTFEDPTAGTKTLSELSASDIVGPASSTDNAVSRWDGAGGDTLQDSSVIVDDSGNISGVGTLGCGAITSTGDLRLDDGSGASPIFWLINESDDTSQMSMDSGGDLHWNVDNDLYIQATGSEIDFSATTFDMNVDEVFFNSTKIHGIATGGTEDQYYPRMPSYATTAENTLLEGMYGLIGGVISFFDGSNQKQVIDSGGGQEIGGDLSLISTSDGATGPTFDLYLDSASPADNDNVGVITFTGNNSADNETIYAKIVGASSDVTSGTEDGSLIFYVQKNNSLDFVTTIGYTGTYVWGGGQLYVYDSANTNYITAYHDGTNGIISTNTGDINLISADDINLTSSDDITLEATDDLTLEFGSDSADDFLVQNSNSQIKLFYDQSEDNWTVAGSMSIVGDVLPSSDSSKDIGSNTVRWANGYFDDIYYTGGNLPDDYDDLKLIKEKYSPENYNGKDVSLNESLGLCIGAIKQLIDKVDKLEERINEIN